MSALHVRDIAWQPAWVIARADDLARLRAAVVGSRDPLVHALVAEIRTLRRWWGYAQAERDGLRVALARRHETIRGLRQDRRPARTSTGPAPRRDRRRGDPARSGSPDTAMWRPRIAAMEGRDASRQAVDRGRADAPQTPDHTVRPRTADSHRVF